MKINLSKIYIFEWAELEYSELEYELGIDTLHKLNTNLENSLIQAKLDFDEMIDKDNALQSMEPEDQVSYYSQIFEREGWILEKLKRQQRYSIILSIFSFFEGQLKSICELIECTFKFKIKIIDLNNNEDLMRYWNYLEKVYEIETDDITQFFTPIKQQKIVRNIIAHQEGILNEGQLKKINVIKGLSISKIGDINRIEIEKDYFVIYLLDNIKNFFEKLLLEIDKKYKERI